MDDPRRSQFRVIAALLLVSQLANVAPALAAPAPAKTTASAAQASGLVTRAQGYYRDARYDEAVGLLAGPILRKELSGKDLVEARLVLARCYVKKGILPRAREHFGAILALDPAFTLDKSRADAEELALFNEVKGVPATPAPVATGKPATGQQPPPATAAPAPPTLQKPDVAAAGPQKESWLKKNKFLAIGLVVGGGVAVGLAASGGGGGSSLPPGPQNLPGFPSVPGRP